MTFKDQPTSAAGSKDKAERHIGRRSTGVIVARETRAHQRFQTELEVRISTLDALVGEDSDPYFVLASAVTQDVADGGLRLETDAELEAGRRVVVEVELGGGQTIERKGQVVWVAREEADTIELGVKFDEPFLGLALHASQEP